MTVGHHHCLPTIQKRYPTMKAMIVKPQPMKREERGSLE